MMVVVAAADEVVHVEEVLFFIFNERIIYNFKAATEDNPNATIADVLDTSLVNAEMAVVVEDEAGDVIVVVVMVEEEAVANVWFL